MLLVDDLLIKPFFSLLKTFRAIALTRMYDPGEIRDRIKENQLLYELGERSEAEYERKRERLERELALAEQVHEQVSGRVTVKG